jgi:hypothetical protein
MHHIDDNCLLCLDSLGSITTLSTPRYCNCNVYIHNNCLVEIEQNGLACPICRLKFPLTKETYNHVRILQPNSILEYPIVFCVNNLNILTFILLILYSSIVTFLFVVPYVLYLYIKETIKLKYNIRMNQSISI